MNQFLKLFFIVHLLIYPCQAQIIEAKNLKIISKELKKAHLKTLVVFDVDDVLIVPTDEFLFKTPIRAKLNKKLKLQYSQIERKSLFSDFFMKRKVKLVNSKIVDLLKELEQKKIPTTALTGWWTGPYGKISQMENLRFKGLEDVGISFIKMSPFNENWIFPELKTNDGVPMVKQGIILTALADKGLTLKAVLNKSKLQFTTIIFIDDSLAYLESVEKVCKDMGIEFLGIHYTEANFLPQPVLNEEKEKIRFKTLEEESIWLLDDELEKRVKSINNIKTN